MADMTNEIKSLVERFGSTRSSLLPILNEVQHKHHYISLDAIKEIGKQLNLFPAEVQGVISFYAFLSTEPKNKIIVRVSTCVPCVMAGAYEVIQKLEDQFGNDSNVTIEETSCIGMCDQAPAMLVNDIPFTNLTPKSACKIIKKSKAFEEIKTTNTNQLTFDTISADAGLKNALSKSADDTIAEVTESKLKGCGGAGFPAGLKLKFTATTPGDVKYIVCNADEGEPGTFKDRHILTNTPDVVFEGMTIAAHATGASKGIVYLRAEYIYLKDHLEAVLEKRRSANLLGKSILDSGLNFDIEIRMGAGAYVCGSETALLESLEGKRGEARNKPPFPIQKGYLNLPTMINNVETFAWMSAVMEKGAKWFNQVGTEQSAGYKLFSISGDCKHPGVYELPMGTTINEMLKIVGGEGAKAVQSAGAAGICIPACQFDRKLGFEDAPPSGSIMVFGPNRNMLDIAENFMEFFVEESCGQCTPCRCGNPKILDGVKLLKEKKCSDQYLNDLINLAKTMQTCSKCGLGQYSAVAFLSIVENFKEEF